MDVSPINLQTTLVAAVAFLLSWCVLQIYFRYSQARRNLPPGPKSSSFLWGNFNLLNRNPKAHLALDKLHREFGDIVYLRLGLYPAVVINSYKVAKEAFVNKADVFNDRPIFLLHKLLKAEGGILNGNGTSMKQMRRFAIGTLRDFGVGKKSMDEMVHDEAQILCSMLDNQIGKAINLASFTSNSVVNIICCLIFGRRQEYEDPDFVTMSKALDLIFAHGGLAASGGMFMPFVIPAAFKSGHFYRVMKCVYELQNYIWRQIEDHKVSFDEQNMRDFIDHYIKNELDDHESFSKDNLFKCINDLFIAGAETVNTTLRWAFLFMIHHPDVQERCRKEILDVVGQGRLPTSADRQNMPYVQATLTEVQRRGCTVAVSLLRRTNRDSELAGYDIPRGTIVFFNMYSAQHDPSHWQDPEHFNPGRWLDARGDLIKDEAFVPFSMGPRACPGEALARTELFLFFSMLLQRFEFKAEEPDKLPTLGGTNGITHHPDLYKVVMSKI